MKKLVIEILEKNGAQYWRVKKQTHRRRAFGICLDNNVRHGGFFVESSSYPETAFGGAYVRGAVKERDNDLMPVPDAEWLASFEATIKAYNKWGATQKEPKAIKYARPKGYKLVRVIE